MTAAALVADFVRSEPRTLVDPRSVPVRFSRLKKMGQSAAHYFASLQDDTDDTLAMRLGRGTHAIVLGDRRVAKWDEPAANGKGGKAPRTGDRWAKFQEDNADAEILNATEWEHAHRMAEAILNNAFAYELIRTTGAIVEQTIEWSINGRACTSRPDVRHGASILADVKTARSTEPRKFSRDAQWQGYHAQFAFYNEAIRFCEGKAPDENYVIAVEKGRPHVVTILDVTKRTIEEGEKFWRLWWERLAVCEQTDVWPGYTQTVETFDIVDDGEFTLTVGGEEIEL